MRVAVPIQLTDEERQMLTRWARWRHTPARLVLRTKIVLRAVDGHRNHAIAQELNTDRECVSERHEEAPTLDRLAAQHPDR